jgi:hypothetical protein
MLAPKPLAPLSAGVLVMTLLFSIVPASATPSWAILLHTSSTAEAHAQTAPSPPSGATAACVSSSQREIKVSWTAVTHATNYTVYESTTSASSGYSSAATGVTSATWTSANLAAGNYWFEVATHVGTTWVSANSSATSESTTKTSGTECTQP